LVAGIFSIVFSFRGQIVFVVFTRVFSSLDHCVDQFQLVSGVAFGELSFDALIHVEEVLNGFNVHSRSAQDWGGWNKLSSDFTSLVEDERWAVLVLEVFD